MPAVGGALLPIIFTSAAVAANIGLWGQLLIYAMTSFSSWAMAERPAPPVPRGRQIQVNTNMIDISLPLIYGKVRISGNDIHYYTRTELDFMHVPENRYLWIVEVLCEGECEGIAQEDGHDLIYVDDHLVDSVNAWDPYGQEESRPTAVQYWFHSGSPTQTVDTNLNAEDPSWTLPLKNTCYIVWKFDWRAGIFRSLPKRSVVLKGRKVWKPSNVKEYTANAAAVLYDYLRSPHCAVGLGWPEEDTLFTNEIDRYSYNSCYNYCEAKGWEYNGLVVTDEKLSDVLSRLKMHFRGELDWNDGMFYMMYKDLNYEAPVMSLTDEHLARDSDGKAHITMTQPGLANKVDRMIVKFVNSTDNEFFEDGTFVGEKEGTTVLLDLPGIIIREKAGALGSYYLERNKDPFDRIITGMFRDDVVQLRKGNLITTSFSALGSVFADEDKTWNEVAGSDEGATWNVIAGSDESITWNDLAGSASQQYMRVLSVNILPTGLVQLDLQLEHSDLYNDQYDAVIENVYRSSLPTGEVDYFNPQDSPLIYIPFNNGGTLLTKDLNRVYVVDNNNDVDVYLPSISDESIGSWLKFIHYGTGKLTIHAADSDYVDESSPGGSIWHKEWS